MNLNSLKFVTPARVTWVLFVIPVALATVFYTLMAADRYASVAVVSVRDTSSLPTGGSSSVAALLGGAAGGSLSLVDTFFVQNYIQSSDLMLKLDKRFNLRAHYSAPRLDVLYRLSADARREDFLNYFRNRIKVTLDETSGLLTIEAQGFEPAFAQKLTQAVVEETEAVLNENAHRIAHDRMLFAEQEVERTAKSQAKVRADLLAFQTQHRLLDPLSQAAANSTLTASLQATQAKQEADLKAAQAYLSEDSLQVRSLRSQLEATKAQIEVERLRATGTVDGAQLTALASQYQNLLALTGFADEEHKLALAAAEQARMDTVRKLKTLMVLEPATLPDLATYPHRVIDWLTVVAVCGMLFTIVRLAMATIREHQD
ncbi:capsular biosynthesis protein [Ideonella dechloratans]|uniref:Capsular biosynthesis protein n=1 Tax=Ideonella dechloratans TaxID=36863 RepID=A0A643FEG8_IDEDE|nr:capsular biosynthesis protein [Ideonella dechloratans]KAB0582481.1 capsular biosynthesis protein [Ideonella dechloratans]UFU10523.1 capsular biosynthesis protein [Ideonella dechloratans]